MPLTLLVLPRRLECTLWRPVRTTFPFRMYTILSRLVAPGKLLHRGLARVKIMRCGIVRRFCEARVWSMFTSVMGADWGQQYLDYAQGHNLSNRMPLWVKPPSKLSAAQVMAIMRSHYEGTELDMSGVQFSDVGAVYSSTPVRTHPLSWSSTAGSADGTTVSEYFNERPIATQQTGWNFVAQSRKWMKPELSGLLWFGVDDSSTTVHFPIYGSATEVPLAFAGAGAQDGQTPPMMVFDMQRAHHVFNLVANWAYTR
jgi:dipeptidase